MFWFLVFGLVCGRGRRLQVRVRKRGTRYKENGPRKNASLDHGDSNIAQVFLRTSTKNGVAIMGI